jgi:hypothetical protein
MMVKKASDTWALLLRETRNGVSAVRCHLGREPLLDGGNCYQGGSISTACA